ncbi:MAG: hypothetical protein ACI4CE_07500 [Methanomethylophilus alvi]
MDGEKKRKCRNCGQMFVPKGTGDAFCSSLCRLTGKFVGGGGDTSKPLSYEQRKALEKKGLPIPKPNEKKPKKIRNGGEKFPRVVKMFSLPMSQRWELAKTFTAEEREFSRRMEKRLLMEERKMASFIDWDGDSEPAERGSYDGIVGGTLGESDDGTV